MHARFLLIHLKYLLSLPERQVVDCGVEYIPDGYGPMVRCFLKLNQIYGTVHSVLRAHALEVA
jgi:hypothetical protein